MTQMRSLLGRLGFAVFGGRRRRGAGGGEPPAEAGQWDFSDAAQSGHLLTAGF